MTLLLEIQYRSHGFILVQNTFYRVFGEDLLENLSNGDGNAAKQ